MDLASTAAGASPRDEDRGAAARPRSETFEGVQILRGLAASMVVFHHACLLINRHHPHPSTIATYHSLAQVGASGVDIFFCISGFVIAYAARNLPAGGAVARTFAWRRILRVLPPYWVFTCGLLLMWVTGIGLKGLIVTPALVATSLLLIPYPKATAAGPAGTHPILDVGWTLSFEMYFYAVCTLVVAFAGGRRLWPWALALLAAGAALSLALLGPAALATGIMASPLLLEFVAGVGLARFLAGRRSLPLGLALMALGAAGLWASVYVPDPEAWRALCWGVPGMLMVAGGVLLPVTLESPGVRMLSFLGTASYSIYLAHPFVMLVSANLVKRGILARIAPDLLLLLLTAGAIMVAAATYFIVEGPLVQLLKPRSRTAAEARAVLKS